MWRKALSSSRAGVVAVLQARLSIVQPTFHAVRLLPSSRPSQWEEASCDLLAQWSGVCRAAYLHEGDQPCRASHDFRVGKTWYSPK